MGAELAGETLMRYGPFRHPPRPPHRTLLIPRGKSHFAVGKPGDTNVETAGNETNRCPDVLAGGPEKTVLLL